MKRYFFRTIVCISSALALLLTSIGLPVRQAESLVALTPMVVETVGALIMIAILAPKGSVVHPQCNAMFPTHNNKNRICDLQQNTTFLTIQAQVFTYIAAVCPALQPACLKKLHENANTLLQNIALSLRKNPQAFRRICPVLQTLFRMTIPEYCAANGYGSSSPIVAESGTPPKGGNGKTIRIDATLPYFIPKFISWLKAIVDAWVAPTNRACDPTKEMLPLACPKNPMEGSKKPTEGNKKKPREAFIADGKTRTKFPLFETAFVRAGTCQGISFYIPLDKKTTIGQEKWTSLCAYLLKDIANKKVYYDQIVFAKNVVTGNVYLSERERVYIDVDLLMQEITRPNKFKKTRSVLVHEGEHCRQLHVFAQCAHHPMGVEVAKVLRSVMEAGAVIAEIAKTPPQLYMKKVIYFNNNALSVDLPTRCLSDPNFTPGVIAYLCAALVVQYFTNIYNAYKLPEHNAVRDVSLKLIALKVKADVLSLWSERPPVTSDMLIVKLLGTQTKYKRFLLSYTVQDVHTVEKKISGRLAYILQQYQGKTDPQALRDALCNDPILPKLAYCR
jgi:hypothetical protein